MKTNRHVELTETEVITLRAGYKNHPKHHFREKCHALILSHEGARIGDLARTFDKKRHTISGWMTAWEGKGLRGLYISKGRGRRGALSGLSAAQTEEIKKVAEQPLKLLSIVSGVGRMLGGKVSKDMLKKFLKKQGYTYRRIRKWLKGVPDEAEYQKKVKELALLAGLEKHGFLTLYFADESGFSETPCIPYGWQPKNEGLRIPSGHGRRCNVFGLMSRQQELHAWDSEKPVDAAFVIGAIDDFVCDKSRKGRSIIILDNAKIHHSRAFKAKQAEWAAQNVGIFYLPTYSPHLNLIETLWRKIKYEWLLPQHFENFQTMKNQLLHILKHFGAEFSIHFDEQ